MPSFRDYVITEKLYSDVHTSLYRAERANDREPVFLNTLHYGPLFVTQRRRFERDFEMGGALDLPCVVKPYALKEHNVGMTMILEDFGGVPLAQLLSQDRLTLVKAIEIALHAAEALGDIHSRGIMHKDIRPENLIYNAKARQLKITGFGISTTLKHESPTNKAVQLHKSALSYMSPEQTGRMNRSVDYRTDFYSLGVTMYQSLTGQLPFTTGDDLELIYCLMARNPLAPATIDAMIPVVVSQIVMKLLSKAPEDRYQSAFGLAADLRECHRQLEQTEEIQSFELGRYDRSESFRIPEKLYGREQQVDTLLKAFERVGQGPAEMMLVAGYSGIGKSTLINELHKPVAQQRGYFISGKCDQYKRHIPYSALIDAFDELIRLILTEPEDRIDIWRHKLINALSPNGQVLIDVIPSLELIIGTQAAVVQLPPSETQNRFDIVLVNFLRIFAQEGHQLVMFLDDLQWVDSSSLRLLELLITNPDSQYFLLLGAYRDNEVDVAHPLMLTLEAICASGAIVNTVHLTPLVLQDVMRLCADTLGCQVSQVQPLAQLVFEKTGGNPFFLRQFLEHLVAQGALSFDFSTGVWQWDIDQIRNMAITDNVIDLMSERIQELPTATRDALKLAACIGNRFNLDMLVIVSERTPVAISKDLWVALQTEILIPLSAGAYAPEFSLQVAQTDTEYRFLHDRLQEAAYALIPVSDRKSVHLRIGRTLMRETCDDDRESLLFDIVNHLNIGADLINNRTERNMLAHLNLQAGRKAKMSTAYADARRFLLAGIDLLSPESWRDQYDLTLNLYVEAVEIEYLNTNFDAAQRLSEIVIAESQNVLDQVSVHVTRVEFLITQNRMVEALDAALPVLEMLGYPVTEDATELRLCAPLPSIDKLDDMPMMTDPKQLAAVRLLTIITGASYQGKPELFTPIAFVLVNLCQKHGLSSLAAYAYGIYAMLLCGPLNDIENGYYAGRLSLQILERFPTLKYECKVHFLFDSFIRHWKEPHRATMLAYTDTVQMGLETGDFVYVAYCRIWSSGYLMLTGHQLAYIEEQQRLYAELMMKLKQENGLYPIRIWRQLTLNLQGDSDDKYNPYGESFSEDDMRVIENTNVVLTLFFAHFAWLIQAYIYGDFAAALTHAKATEAYEIAATASMLLGGYVYYDALARLAAYAHIEHNEQQALMARVDLDLLRLREWSHHAPMNFKSKVTLVEAEKARVNGHVADAMRLYEQACNLARENGFPQELAIAAERAHDFYAQQNLDRVARIYIQEAYDAYCVWGAHGKAKDIAVQYTHSLAPAIRESSSEHYITDSPSPLLASTFDAATLLKASQAISGEIERSELLRKLMQLAIENAGARQGVLVVNHSGDLRVEIVVADSSDDVQVMPSVPLHTGNMLPTAIIRLVARTRETIVLGDAVADGRFTQDPYVVARKPRSVLCIPVCRHDDIRAILYLENNLSANVFTSERLAILNVLLAQAAISLDNADLFEKQMRAEENMRHLRNYLANIIDSMPSVLIGVDEDGTVTQWNIEAQRLTKIIAAEAVGQPLARVFPRLAADIGRVREAIKTREVQIDPKRVRRENDKITYEDVTIYPLIADGVEGAVIRVDDVTERVRLEEMLVQSEKMLSVGGLAAGMAHEINNPLSGMMQTAQLMALRLSHDLPTNEQAAEAAGTTMEAIRTFMEARGILRMLTDLSESGQRIAKIVSNMLSFAQRSVAQTSSYNMAELLDKTLELAATDYDLTKQYDFKMITIVREYQEDLPYVQCEGSKIQQVFLNILRNGAQAMQEAGIENPTLVLRVWHEKERGMVRIEITDNGPGMDEATRKRVFEPFFTTKPVGVGTGLGLSISYFIITENHEGQMSVESAIGKGTTFIIRLPVKKGDHIIDSFT